MFGRDHKRRSKLLVSYFWDVRPTMQMPDYMREIEFAARSTLDTMWRDHLELDVLSKKIAASTAEMNNGYLRAQFIAGNAETPEDVADAIGAQFDTYFGPDKERHHATQQHTLLEEKATTRSFSRSALATALLQYAKQGISVVHKDLASCPVGRMIGAQPLKAIIWQGRNQAIHWEDGNPHNPVKQCFNALALSHGPDFSKYTTENLAFRIAEMLNWRSYEDFERDMLSIA